MFENCSAHLAVCLTPICLRAQAARIAQGQHQSLAKAISRRRAVLSACAARAAGASGLGVGISRDGTCWCPVSVTRILPKMPMNRAPEKTCFSTMPNLTSQERRRARTHQPTTSPPAMHHMAESKPALVVGDTNRLTSRGLQWQQLQDALHVRNDAQHQLALPWDTVHGLSRRPELCEAPTRCGATRRGLLSAKRHMSSAWR